MVDQESARVPEPSPRRTKFVAGVGCGVVVLGLLAAYSIVTSPGRGAASGTASDTTSGRTDADAAGASSSTVTPANMARTDTSRRLTSTSLIPSSNVMPTLPTTTRLDPSIYRNRAVDPDDLPRSTASTTALSTLPSGAGTPNDQSTTTLAPTTGTTAPGTTAPGTSGAGGADTMIAGPSGATLTGALVVAVGDELARVGADGTGRSLGTGRRPALHPGGIRLVFEWQGAVWESSPDAVGSLHPILGNAVAPAWSPDGQRLAITRATPGADELWVAGVDGSGAAGAAFALPGITAAFASANGASWAPDGHRIALVAGSARGGRDALAIADATAPGAAPRVLATGGSYDAPAWAPAVTGDVVAVVVTTGAGARLDLVDVSTGATRTLPVTCPVGRPAWSPDGTHLVVVTTTPTGWALVVTNADGTAQRIVTTSTSPLSSPTWR